MSSIRRIPRIHAIAGATLLAAVPMGCGDDDDPGPGDAEVGVAAHDYEFRGLPPSVATGATLTLANESAVEVHELVAIRLPENEVRSVDEILQVPPGELEELLAVSPAVVLVAAPRSAGTAVLGSATLDQPGRYAIVCFIPTGADPDEVMRAVDEFDPLADEEPPELDGGPPHFAQGMQAELVVS